MEFPKFDLSKPPHPQIIDLFVPFIPGLFFEISVAIADRGLTTAVFSFGLGPYSRGALFLFGAYFGGLTAMVLSTLLLRGVVTVYRLLYVLADVRIRKFEMRVMHERPASNTALRSRRVKLASWLQSRRIAKAGRARTVSKVWGAAAMQLLSRRYGIEAVNEQFSSDEWAAWRVIIGVPTDQEARGSSLVRALGASGWAGLLARHIAWPLSLFHYRTFCIVLIVCAIVHSLLVARLWMDPVEAPIVLTRNVLRELAESGTGSQEQNED